MREPRFSPLLWEAVRQEMRVLTGMMTKGRQPSTGAIAVFVARRLCERVQVFGFGNSSWNCLRPGRAVCAKYYTAPLRTRTCRGRDTGRYVGGAGAAWHDFPMEWRWLEVLIRRRLIDAPRCAQLR